MNNNIEEISLPTLGSIKKLLDPIYSRLENIEASVKKQETKPDHKKYYRNQDLKKIFGLSNNTIIKYRNGGILPFTHLGDVYLYDINTINAILISNQL